MKDSEKYLGAIFLVISLVDLLRQDWLGFALLSISGAGLLFGSKLKLPRGVEIALAVLLFGLFIVRVVILVSR